MKIPHYSAVLSAWLLCIISLPAIAYEISADGSEVTDPRTGLTWRRCVEGMNWNGTTCIGMPLEINHEAALRRATEQAKSSGIAWRLPNIKELSSLMQNGRRNPTIDVVSFPATPFYTQTWSSTPDVKIPHSAWVFSFSYANIYSNDRQHEGYARLVRDAN